MRIFFDTNIIIELLENRTQAEQVDQILCLCEQNNWDKYISVGSFYTITYLTERLLRRKNIHQPELVKQQRLILRDILTSFNLPPTTKSIMQAGIDDTAFFDLEDSYQNQSAMAAECSILLTINTKDFPANSRLRIMSPNEFLNIYNIQQ